MEMARGGLLESSREAFSDLPSVARLLIVSTLSISDAIRLSVALGPAHIPVILALVRTAQVPEGRTLSSRLAAALTGLQSLEIKDVREFHSDIILHMMQLQELKTMNCGLDKTDVKRMVTALKNTLTALDLSNKGWGGEKNRIGDIGAGRLAELTRLQQLGLAGNRLGPAAAAHIARLTTLKQLDLSNNRKIGPDGAQHLTQLSQLTRLDMGKCSLGDAGAASVAQITSLCCLSIEDDLITDEGVCHLTSLCLLQQLDLSSSMLELGSGNKVGAIGAQALAKLTRLQELNVNWNDVGEEGAARLVTLPGLRTFKVSASEFTPAGLKALSRLAPTLEQLYLNDAPQELDLSYYKSIDWAGCCPGVIASMAKLTTLHCWGFGEGDRRPWVVKETSWLSSLKGLASLTLKGVCRLTGKEDGGGLEALTALTHLDLSGSKVAPAALEQLKSLAGSLVSLNLNRALLHPVMMEAGDSHGGGGNARLTVVHLTALTRLTLLNISMNEGLKAGEVAHIGTLTGLRELKADRNYWRPAEAASLAGLTNLTHLDISHNILGPAGAAEVAKLSSLRDLDISYNNLGVEGGAALAALYDLTALYASCNQLGAAGWAHLNAHPRLVKIGITRAEATAAFFDLNLMWQFRLEDR